jgi:hypothetical protein
LVALFFFFFFSLALCGRFFPPLPSVFSATKGGALCLSFSLYCLSEVEGKGFRSTYKISVCSRQKADLEVSGGFLFVTRGKGFGPPVGGWVACRLFVLRSWRRLPALLCLLVAQSPFRPGAPTLVTPPSSPFVPVEP